MSRTVAAPVTRPGSTATGGLVGIAPEELMNLRLGFGWSQTQAAARVGVTANTWARWERAEVSPHPLRVPMLRRVLRAAYRRGPRTGVSFL